VWIKGKERKNLYVSWAGGRGGGKKGEPDNGLWEKCREIKGKWGFGAIRIPVLAELYLPERGGYGGGIPRRK